MGVGGWWGESKAGRTWEAESAGQRKTARVNIGERTGNKPAFSMVSR